MTNTFALRARTQVPCASHPNVENLDEMRFNAACQAVIRKELLQIVRVVVVISDLQNNQCSKQHKQSNRWFVKQTGYTASGTPECSAGRCDC